MPAAALLKHSIVIYTGVSPCLATTTKSQFYPGRNELGGILENVRFDIMKETILSREFELEDSIDNGVQPLTAMHIEPDMTVLSTGVSDSFDLPQPPPQLSILQTEHNSEDDEHIPPPPLLSTELTLSNELVPDRVHHMNSPEDKHNPTLKTTTCKQNREKKRKLLKINLPFHLTIVGKSVELNSM